MGTRSLTVFIDEFNAKPDEICVMYRQMDGYVQGGHGEALAEFLKDFVIVNGYGMERKGKHQANGMSCLCAQVIAYFKEGVGGFYIHPAGSRDMSEEYIYTISGKIGEIPSLEVKDASRNKILYAGKADKVWMQITGKEMPKATDNLRELMLDYHNDLPDVVIQMAHDKKNYDADPVAGTIAAEFFRKYFPEDSDYYRVINGICKHHPIP